LPRRAGSRRAGTGCALRRGIMALTTFLFGLTLFAAPADTVRAPKAKPEAVAPARPAKPNAKVEPKRTPPPKPKALGEPKLKRRKLPD
jgi:hypothetical protein